MSSGFPIIGKVFTFKSDDVCVVVVSLESKKLCVLNTRNTMPIAVIEIKVMIQNNFAIIELALYK